MLAENLTPGLTRIWWVGRAAARRGSLLAEIPDDADRQANEHNKKGPALLCTDDWGNLIGHETDGGATESSRLFEECPHPLASQQSSVCWSEIPPVAVRSAARAIELQLCGTEILRTSLISLKRSARWLSYQCVPLPLAAAVVRRAWEGRQRGFCTRD